MVEVLPDKAVVLLQAAGNLVPRKGSLQDNRLLRAQSIQPEGMFDVVDEAKGTARYLGKSEFLRKVCVLNEESCRDVTRVCNIYLHDKLSSLSQNDS